MKKIFLLLFVCAGLAGCNTNKIATRVVLPTPTYEIATMPAMANVPDIGTTLSTYTTFFGTWDVDRTHNILIATDKINEKIIYPNQIFSFNEVVGPRTPQNGFRISTIFIDKKKAKGYGGGVCQVSSTLYNSVAGAELEILEKHNHLRKVQYVPDGQDATVSYGILDFKFVNNKPYPIKIRAFVTGGNLTTEIVSI